MRAALSLSLFLIAAPAPAQESLEVGVPPGMVERYLTAIARQHWEARAARVAAIRTPAEVADRQAYIRRKVVEALGGWPEKTPLNARITGTLERPGYRVEKLIYESLPRYYVTASVYVPATGKPPYPAVLGTAGHSATGKAIPIYQRVWIALAKRGILVLAYDPQGQGERSQYFDAETGKPRFGSTAEHTMAGAQCLLTGANIARYELWDGIRAVDYLLTRKDVDPKRIGVAGNSGGGTQTAYLQVVEPRLAAAAPSCYLTSWEKLWAGPGPQDAEQNFAGFLSSGLDFPDFLIAFAPRPVKMMTAIRDYFPIDGARATFAEARRIYELMGAGDRIEFFEYDDPHGWSKPRREATYRWMEKWLNNRTDEGIEPEFETEPEANLNSTPTGQLATSLGGETVQSLNRALAERIYPERAAVKTKDLRALVRARLGMTETRGAPAAVKRGEIGRDGYRIEKIALDVEPGITVPALVFVPVGTGLRPVPAILYVNPAGKRADAAPGGDIESLVRAGYVVMAPDLRGWGETGPAPRGSSGYAGMWQLSMRAILTGKTLLGMQAGDLLRAFDYLAARGDADPSRIAVIGKGNGGVAALVAAALEPRIQKVATERTIVSYLEFARARLHEGLHDIIVPGVLRDFDLPDLAAAIAPRTVFAAERPDGSSFEKVYAEWLRK